MTPEDQQVKASVKGLYYLLGIQKQGKELWGEKVIQALKPRNSIYCNLLAQESQAMIKRVRERREGKLEGLNQNKILDETQR